jgi:twitching motility protein PilT
MREQIIQGRYHQLVQEALKQSPLFGNISDKDLEAVLSHGKLLEFAPNEVIIQEGDISDSFYLLVRGQASVLVKASPPNPYVELGRISPPNIFGEMGLLLRNHRTASVIATEPLLALQFHHQTLDLMFDGIKGFGRQLSAMLALRLVQTSRRAPMPFSELHPEDIGAIEPQVLRLIPTPFVLRHRVLPLQFANNLLTMGFVDDPTPTLIQAIQSIMPGVQLRPQRISNESFTRALTTHGMLPAGSIQEPNKMAISEEPPVIIGISASQTDIPIPRTISEIQAQIAKIKPLLQRIVEEGASDLYLSAQEKPRWRIGGQLHIIEDYRPLQPLEAFKLLSGLIPQPRYQQFEDEHHTDFSCTIKDLSRFRISLFRTEKGINAVLRPIPLVIPTLEQLQHPPAIRAIAGLNDGLVIITGVKGSGKTTTIAALLEAINDTRNAHILTLEDPIEYLHNSRRSLIHQREIGSHSKDFQQAIRSAIRENPDILVISDLQSSEAIYSAIELARSKHLVLGCLNTRGAINAINHLLEQFSEEQRSHIRHYLSEILRCVVSQELCNHRNGNRIAAFEYLAIDPNSAALIRKGDISALLDILCHQPGNFSIHTHLAQLVQTGQISTKTAFNHAFDTDIMQMHLQASAAEPV